MAKRSRESRMRAVRVGTLAPIQCAACGQRFWTQEQERAHQAGVRDGVRRCVYSPVDPDRDHMSNSEMYAELAAAGADPYARSMRED